MIRTKRAVAVSLAMVVLATGSAFAQTADVTVVTLAGSRIMSVKSLTGDNLTALSMGTAREAGFLVNVTDLVYDRKGYQVTTMLTNLYKYAATYDCNAPSIAASKLSVGYLANPTSIKDIAAAAAPLLNFSGTIAATSPLFAALGLTGASNVNVASNVTQQLIDYSTSTVYSGAETLLPMNVATGSSGVTFTAAAAHTGCGGGAATPTTIKVQQGTVNTHADFLNWLKSRVLAGHATAAGPDGVLSAAEAASGAIITQAGLDDSVRTALIALGVNSTILNATPSLISDVEALMSATPISSISTSDVLRQTGTYSTLPKLIVGDLTGIPTGAYKGTMTLTLVIDP